MTDLYVLGSVLDSDAKAVAVVGSRMVSSKGAKLTRIFVEELVRHGYTIVSGLARGVDTIAHQEALKSGGRTIAVIGSGINIIYPPENKNLAMEISKKGAVISPFPENTKPFGKNFLARNRVIVKLSLGVLVIEGKRRSGTLSTAAHAAREGKEVFAIPGSEATDYLIGEGANSVKSPEELMKLL